MIACDNCVNLTHCIAIGECAHSEAPPQRLYELREWLVSKIDGAIESYGEDSLISSFINQIDALPIKPERCKHGVWLGDQCYSCAKEQLSEMGTIPSDPAAETPITQALVSMLGAGWLSLGSSAPGAVKPLVEALEVFERENADLKQRLLPQANGRAERAQRERQMIAHERDSLLEKLRAATSMPCAPSATAAIHAAMPTEQMVTKGVEAMIAYIFNDAPGEMLAMDGRREAMRAAYIAMVKAADSQATAPPVEETATRNAALEEAAKECDAGVDGAGRPYAEAIRALKGSRMKGGPVECGYDRSASLNSGKYVCLCGGTCSHYDAKQP